MLTRMGPITVPRPLALHHNETQFHPLCTSSAYNGHKPFPHCPCHCIPYASIQKWPAQFWPVKWAGARFYGYVQ